MKSSLVAVAAVCLLGGCVSESTAPQYSLTGGEQGVFRSANAGRAIPVAQIKGMDDNQLKATFGTPALDRKDGPMRALRYQSDGCSLWVYVSAGRAQYAEAYDPQLRPLASADQCAGSVAAQKRTA
jgi:hypothetical protein